MSGIEVNMARVPAKAQHNNGMHATADTMALIFLQSRGAAGDAGR